MTRAHMNEMDAEAVNHSLELRPLIEIDFSFAPIVRPSPVVDERLQRHQWRSLIPGRPGFPVGPTCRIKSMLEIGQHGVAGVIGKGNDLLLDRSRPGWQRQGNGCASAQY